MSDQTFSDILDLRAQKNRLNNGKLLNSDEDAIEFIKQRGVVLLSPDPHLPLPNISEADNAEPWPGFPVTDHAWRWKEVLPAEKKCAYGKIFRHRGTFMSWPIFAAYYRLFGPECDEEEEYARGHLNQRQLLIVETIREEGAMDSRALWKVFRMKYGGKRPSFVKDLEELQVKLFLTVSGGSLEGWSCHAWDLVERQTPREIIQSLPTFETAKRDLLACWMANAVACLPREAASVLRISYEELKTAVSALTVEETTFPDRRGTHWLWMG